MNGMEKNENQIPEPSRRSILPIYIGDDTAQVPARGLVSHKVQKEKPNRESKLPEIVEKLRDPNFSIQEIKHLILFESALIAKEASTSTEDQTSSFEARNRSNRSRALRALERAVNNADLGAKSDVLNFDGPKFTFVFCEFTRYFRKAAEEALPRDHLSVNTIMKLFRDNLATHEPEIRRATAKIGNDFEGRSPNPTVQKPTEPDESCKNENPHHPEIEPTVQLKAESSHETDTLHQDRPDVLAHRNYVEREASSVVPYQGLIESPEDLILFRKVIKDVIREEVSDHNLVSPKDSEIKPRDPMPEDISLSPEDI